MKYYLILLFFLFACSADKKAEDTISGNDSLASSEQVPDKTDQDLVDSTIMENEPIYRDSIPH